MTERRKFLKQTLLGASTLFSGSVLAQNRVCEPTAPQTEGPFFPDFDIKESDADLVFMKGKSQRAKGNIVILRGIVQDQMCEPVKGAIVELWQACHTGKYKHASDPNPAELDPNFQYYAKVRTDEKGRFSIRTIIPGAYPATADWERPPHLHFKISLRGFNELTTQTYFKGHPLNKTDKILKSLTPSERKAVIVDFKPTTSYGGHQHKEGFLKLTLNKL